MDIEIRCVTGVNSQFLYLLKSWDQDNIVSKIDHQIEKTIDTIISDYFNKRNVNIDYVIKIETTEFRISDFNEPHTRHLEEINNNGILYIFSDFAKVISSKLTKNLGINDVTIIDRIATLLGNVKLTNDKIKQVIFERISYKHDYIMEMKEEAESSVKNIVQTKNDLQKELEELEKGIERMEDIDKDPARKLSFEELINNLKNQINELAENEKRIKDRYSDYSDEMSIFTEKDGELTRKIEELFQEKDEIINAASVATDFYKKSFRQFIVIASSKSNEETIKAMNQYKKDKNELIQKHNLLEKKSFTKIFPDVHTFTKLLAESEIEGFYNKTMMNLSSDIESRKYEIDIISLLIRILNGIKNKNYLNRRQQMYIPFNSGLLCSIICYESKNFISEMPRIYLNKETVAKLNNPGTNEQIRHKFVINETMGETKSEQYIMALNGILLIEGKHIAEIQLDTSPILLGINSDFTV